MFSVAQLSDPEIKLLNATFFGNDGFLYGYASKTIGPVVSKYLVQINPENGETETIGIGPEANYLDGCSCLTEVYCGMELLQDTVTCFDEEVRIKVFITNRSSTPVTNITFKDTIKQNLKITNIQFVFYNDPFSVHLTPDSVIWYSHINLAPGDSVIFIITLDLSNAVPGTTYQHMGWLENLPGFPQTLGSDNIHTPAVFSDPVTFFYTTPEEAELQYALDFNLISCPDAPTATTSVSLAAPFIEPGKDYIVSYSFQGSGTTEQLVLSANQDSTLEWLITGNGEIQITQIQMAGDTTCALPLDGNFLAEATPPDTTSISLCRNGEHLTIDSTYLPSDATEMQWFASWTSDWQPFSPPLEIATDYIPANSLIGIKYIVDDSCEIEEWIRLEIHDVPLLKLGDTQTFKGGTSVSIQPVIQYDVESLNWTIFDGEEEHTCPGCETLTFTPSQNGVILAEARNAAGCTTMDTLFYNVEFDNSIYVPNCFSPNYDGFNDLFFPFFGCSIDHVETFEIYDRWGELVFRAQNYDPRQVQAAWDGTFRGKAMDPGVFVWYLRYSSTDDTILERTGSVTLLK
ncbi:MAG: gliding motility-associated C-terminal domain-containing protein [Deltaproteobacteria bacterium]|nr:MAG: gliding motility-associated C-terminal domain-containing protein [Deltaproteobacteria bacterium]